MLVRSVLGDGGVTLEASFSIAFGGGVLKSALPNSGDGKESTFPNAELGKVSTLPNAGVGTESPLPDI